MYRLDGNQYQGGAGFQYPKIVLCKVRETELSDIVRVTSHLCFRQHVLVLEGKLCTKPAVSL